MAAAAPNLTPVTLELGGKSPALIAPGYPIEHAAERIAAGKCFNAGQTCVAPDYVLVPRAQRDEFVRAFMASVRRRYPDIAANPDYSAVVNHRQAERLRSWLDDNADEAGDRLWVRDRPGIVPAAEGALAGTDELLLRGAGQDEFDANRPAVTATFQAMRHAGLSLLGASHHRHCDRGMILSTQVI